MPKSRRNTLRTASLLAAATLALPVLTIATPAAAATGPTASVTMGDSYISGEAGRWMGNSDDTSGSRDGTDRAWNGSAYDPSSVYGTTAANGCDRSDSSEVHSAALDQVQLNIACSGATSADIFRASNGGQTYKGEAPQADQLAALATQYKIKQINLSIGGNDLGFTDVITTCVKDYEIWYSYCHNSQQSAIDSKMSAAMAGVSKSVDEIRAVMSAAGYAPGSYQLVLQSYPSPIPRSSEARYPESGWSRTNTGGCPFWDGDLDWARDTMIPEISDNLANVAAGKGVQFLDLRDFLQGHEICSTSTQLATASSPVDATTGEWARFLDYGTTVQGSTQESFHPNYFAQLALGHCMSLISAQPTGNFSCNSTPGQDASGVSLSAR